MEKLKQGKMGQKEYWIAMGTIVFIAIFMAVMNKHLGENGGLVFGIVIIVIMLVSAVMRLRDAGKSMLHLVLVFSLPGYMYVIGFYKSEEWHSFGELEETDTENIDRDGKW